MRELEMAARYSPREVEDRLMRRWLERSAFHAEPGDARPPYVVAIPPPNVTGSLHMGHALNDTIQDILIRYYHLHGYNTLWIVGTDHAGIATQNKVEGQLASEGLRKEDIGRKAFEQRVWEWRREYGSTIIHQLKRLGCACDYESERFTMDEAYQKAVAKVFVSLYEKGDIYRDVYLVNWCVRCGSAISDLEVEHEDRAAKLYYVKYLIAGSNETLIVATTRPETILGDTAVAVNPKDPRYGRFVGAYAVVPLVGREVPLIADEHVDVDFGTGALKITPGHDPDDWEIGLRHELPSVSVIGVDGRMTAEAGEFEGMTAEEARTAVIERLKQEGLFEKDEDYAHAVGTCYRCGTTIEPLLSLQWFMDMKRLVKPAIAAVEDGRVRFVPARWGEVYLDWMSKIRPWCISRQLWWGHRIPVWTCSKCDHEIVAADPLRECPKCAHTDLKQDPDTLDTWFSSGLWTFATLGWPEKTPELSYWYPTTVMETGRDIIFFWVARMIMLSLHLHGEVPFKFVYMHGLVVDEHGQKMSKSKGNFMDLIETADKYGADALRIALVSNVSEGLDMRLYPRKVESYRNFVNKLWNVARFVITTTECKKSCEHLEELKLDELALEDRWILQRLNVVTAGITTALEKFRFSDAAAQLYKFLWDDFADWYVEIAKLKPSADPAANQTKNDILVSVLEQLLRLAHPFVPFVTEAIWQALTPRGDEPLVAAEWPRTLEALVNPQAAADFGRLQELIIGLRQVRADYGIPVATDITVVLPHDSLFDAHQAAIEKLARVSISKAATLAHAMTRTIAGVPIAAQVAEHVDAKKEHKRVTKELTTAEKVLAGLAGRLKNPVFVSKAPQKVVEKERERQKELEKKIVALKSMVEELEQLL